MKCISEYWHLIVFIVGCVEILPVSIIVVNVTIFVIIPPLKIACSTAVLKCRPTLSRVLV